MRFCWAQYSLWAVIALLGLLSILSGCGARGPLELPPEVQERIAQEKQQLAIAQRREQQRLEANMLRMQQHFDAAYPALAALEKESPARTDALARLYTQLRSDAMQPLVEETGTPTEESALPAPSPLATVEASAVQGDKEPPSPFQQLTTLKQLLVKMQQNLDGLRQAKQTHETVLEAEAPPGQDQTTVGITATPAPSGAGTTGVAVAEEGMREAPAAPTLSDEEILARIALIGDLIWRVDSEIGNIYLQESPLHGQAE